jgi:hypothetical protein
MLHNIVTNNLWIFQSNFMHFNGLNLNTTSTTLIRHTTIMKTYVSKLSPLRAKIFFIGTKVFNNLFFKKRTIRLMLGVSQIPPGSNV